MTIKQPSSSTPTNCNSKKKKKYFINKSLISQYYPSSIFIKADGVNSSPLPASIEESYRENQKPQLDQRHFLSTVRAISSIPRYNENKYYHDNSIDMKKKNWIYPSEQQFYNAVCRKGHKVDDKSIPSVVRIHNIVNEKVWRNIIEWEEQRGNNNPRLRHFIGRPKDLSPRAWCNSRLFLKKEPFDRHDWFVDGENHEERKYVIDFYNGELEIPVNKRMFHNTAPSIYLDVRPAWDSDGRVLYDRTLMFIKDSFPGIISFGKYVITKLRENMTKVIDSEQKNHNVNRKTSDFTIVDQE